LEFLFSHTENPGLSCPDFLTKKLGLPASSKIADAPLLLFFALGFLVLGFLFLAFSYYFVIPNALEIFKCHPQTTMTSIHIHFCIT
jgi:hypothetical protein